MRTKCVLLALTLLALCITQAGAAVPGFTGNVDTDFGPFVGDPRFISRDDIVPDAEGILAGCEDQPLGINSFVSPAPPDIPPSGFNLERVVTLYDCTTDTLYVGLDVCDGPPQQKAWDASGDGQIAESPAGDPPGGGVLKDIFSDTGLEDYELEIGVTGGGLNTNVRVIISSINGDVPVGAELPTVANGGIQFFAPLTPLSGVTVDNFKVDGVDIELQVHGLRGAFPPNGLGSFPVRLTTRSGATSDLVNEDVTIAFFDLPCVACMSITKEVSCSPTEGFGPSVTALPGAPVYFRIQVQNCGTDVLNNVTITDELKTEVDNALLSCTGCPNTTPPPPSLNCMPTSTGIPVVTNIGTLTPGQIETFVCTVTTNPAFPVTGVILDAVNEVTATATGDLTGVVVNAGPATASVNLVLPSITCTKLVDDDTNFAIDPQDLTPPDDQFVLTTSPDQVWYKICLTNNGETPIDFGASDSGGCPNIDDSLLDHPGPGVTVPPGTDVGLAFRNALQSTYGSKVLPAGQTICVVIGGVTGVTLDCAFQPFPNTFTACGKPSGTFCLPPGGLPNVSTSCSANVGCICVKIDKEVSCSPDPNGTWSESVTALRGAPVYFRITVSNPCGEDLRDVTITDTLTQEVDNALTACIGCPNTTPPPAGLTCMPVTTGVPVVTNIGNLAAGQSKTFICTVQTNGAFAVIGSDPDATNQVSVTATGVLSGTPVSDGPDDAKVNLVIPDIDCVKLVDDDANPDPAQLGDPTPPTTDLNLTDSVMDVEKAWYWLCVTNNGEVDVSFAPGSCPAFTDAFLETADPQIPGTGVDLDALFRAKLIALFGNHVLQPGQSVCIPVGGDADHGIQFNECVLCGSRNVFTDQFRACGFATKNETDFCLPPGGGECVCTDICEATVRICSPPDIKIDKEVSCSPDPNGTWTESVTALRGTDVYFRIRVTNTGGDDLLNVTITDTLTQEVDNALVSCTGCPNTAPPPAGLNCMPTSTGVPVVTNIGTLGVCETKTFICTVKTNAAFAVIGSDPDATNSVSVVGTSERTAEVVADGPDTARVNLVIPDIDCLKLVDDDANPDPAQAGDPTPPTNDLNLTDDVMDIEKAWYWLCVTNNGEVDVSFAEGAGTNCVRFTDDFLETPDPLIPGTGVDLDAAFRDKLIAQFGSHVLPPGQTVCIAVGGDADHGIQFNECVLCGLKNVFTDQFQACGFATENDICLPPSDGECICTGICEATVRICSPPCIDITKEVSCTPDDPDSWGPSVQVLAGETVYFRVIVTNCGGDNLKDVVITDTITEVDNALLPCTGCELDGVHIAQCIPGSIPLGTLPVCTSKTLICAVPTNPTFDTPGGIEDGCNTARVTGKSVRTNAVVNAGPARACVDILIASITCDQLVANNAEMTDASHSLDLTAPPIGIKQAWFEFCVTNSGEAPVDFTPGADPNCPSFKDDLIKPGGTTVELEGNCGSGPYLIPGTDQDKTALFLARLQAQYGSNILPPGGTVCIVIGPVSFDETKLCCTSNVWSDTFTACGIASQNGVCGIRQVNTGDCKATVVICRRMITQAVPGNSKGQNVHHLGYLGKSGEVISSAPGVFALVPGDNWENFVAAAQVGQPYTLKNVSLIKETPEFIQCADVFPPITVQQQGTANIRLWWPLMYEAPGTTWTLTIQYGTSTLFDDDGPGPHIPSYYHENVWEYKVEVDLDSMKLLLELFHEVPFGLDEVPLISDEVLYPILQAKLDNIIQLVADENLLEAGNALGEFEMEVADACIPVSPRSPYPTGPGTGIASTEENPACCKILIDAEFVGIDLGIFQGSK